MLRREAYGKMEYGKREIWNSSGSSNDNFSIVLLGIRGVGKSTLGVFLSAALNLQLVDTTNQFERDIGQSIAAYRKGHSADDYRRQLRETLNSLLTSSRRCVITCDSSHVYGNISLLKETLKRHLFIHIVRDAEGIQEHLKTLSIAKIHDMLKLGASLCRGCFDYEFFNLSEKAPGDVGHALTTMSKNSEYKRGGYPHTRFLTLKRVERDFISFMRRTLSHGVPLSFESVAPLSAVALEDRVFTYAVRAPLSMFRASEVDIEKMAIGSDAVEVVLDGSDSPFQLIDSRFSSDLSHTVARIRRCTCLPIILHIAIVPAEGEKDAYLEQMHRCLCLSPDYLTIDLARSDEDIQTIVRARNTTKIIGHMDLSELACDWYDPKCMEVYERARKLGCQVVRLVRRVPSMNDNYEIESFRSKVRQLKANLPLIAYNLGRLGRMSVCHNFILSPVLPRGVENSLTDSSVATLPVQEVTMALHSTFVLDSLDFYGIGKDISYSLSPIMQNRAFRACGLPHNYQLYQADHLHDLLPIFRKVTFGGASVSLPFKTQVVGFLDDLSPHAKVIGAVNTVIPLREDKIQTDGQWQQEFLKRPAHQGPVLSLYGENTDWIGIQACLRHGLSPVNAVNSTTRALVIGAGGMARAAIYSLIRLGVKGIFIQNRTSSKAHELAQHYNNIPFPSGYSGSLEDLVRICDLHIQPNVQVIESLGDSWPSSHRFPSIVVCCIPTMQKMGNNIDDFTLPQSWLGNPTGGVMLEVCSMLPSKELRLLTCKAFLQTPHHCSHGPNPCRGT